MIRVGFVIGHSDYSWVGGLNYLRTLIASVQRKEDADIELVLFFPKNTPKSIIDSFDCKTKIVSSALNNYFLYRFVRKILKLTTGVDWILEVILRRSNIDILSHSWCLHHSKKIKTIEWIPDFQHIHYPMFFSKSEHARREKVYRQLAMASSALILSSEVARADAYNQYGSVIKKNKNFVLKFVAHPEFLKAKTSLVDLKRKYGLTDNYFHLPNQFWSHKNHILVVEALKKLRDIDKNFLIICTGHLVDMKNPDHFRGLMKTVEDYELTNQFIVLGLISKEDLYGLMEHSIAVINPSYFEGWSTTVEEAKAMNKLVLLSDILVHKEQGPKNALYFDPNEVTQLMDCLIRAEHLQNSNINKASDIEAIKRYMSQYHKFGEEYINIVKMVGHGK